MNSLTQIMDRARSRKKRRLAVAAAQDEDVLGAVLEAHRIGMIEPVLVGDAAAIRRIAADAQLSLDGVELIEETALQAAAETSVKLVSEGRADFLMKGLIDTSILLKALLSREYDLRGSGLLSHVMIYEPKLYHKLILLTDGGMNIAPTLDEKAEILRNAVACARQLGINPVKVACISAKEKVSEKMPSTVDARALQQMGEAGEFGSGVVVEGPLALDLAVSEEAARIKNFESRVAGDADVLLVPTIEVGNGIGKSMTYLGGAPSAGVIMGAKVPVILTSRADSYETKRYSIALGAVIAGE